MKRTAGWSCVVVMIAVSLPAAAALGGDEASIAADQGHLRGSIMRTTKTEAYTMHEIRVTSGTTVREYLSPAGRVFAVSWQGPSNPDLKQLLGGHFEQFQQAVQARGARRGPLVVDEPGLVVHMGGHMRAFAGRAYIPQLLPAGVSAEAIR